MALVTLLELIERVNERADRGNSKHVADAELKRYINASLQRLYNKIVLANKDYKISTYAFALTTSNTRTLPSDFYQFRGLDHVISADSSAPLKPYNFLERGDYTRPLIDYYYQDRFYRLIGNELTILPAQSAAGDYKLIYVPQMTLLSADNDTFDGYNGWEEWAVIDAAQKCMTKEESSSNELREEKKEIEREITASMAYRNLGHVDTIQDVRSNSYRRAY